MVLLARAILRNGWLNTERPHLSLDMRTPEIAHGCSGELIRKWKNYYPTMKENNSFAEIKIFFNCTSRRILSFSSLVLHITSFF
jgi:hypothetical protein